MKRSTARRLLKLTGLGLLGLAAVAVIGCVRVSNGTWYVKSAELPEGWPALTPVDEVEVKAYPRTRAAIVGEPDEIASTTEPMFMSLFEHIQDNDIAMTAPVAMTYADDPADDDQQAMAMSSMAFLYRRPDLGTAGPDGVVLVQDLPSQHFASVGVRGGYHERSYRRGLRRLEEWRAEHPQWRVTGPPRFLGYNGPFTLAFLRYGEVQLPVERTEAGTGPASDG